MSSALADDVLNTCFICNITREVFETENLSFYSHIKEDHNMWQYLWYFIYLDEKDPTEFTGVEQVCYDKKQSGEAIYFLPLRVARALLLSSSRAEKVDLYSLSDKLTLLNKCVEKIDEGSSEFLTRQEDVDESMRAVFQRDEPEDTALKLRTPRMKTMKSATETVKTLNNVVQSFKMSTRIKSPTKK